MLARKVFLGPFLLRLLILGTERRKSSQLLMLAALICSTILVASLSQTWHRAYAEDVIFIVPGSSDPTVKPPIDPAFQFIQKGQSITFVNPDGLDHELVVKDADGKQVFDTGVLNQNQFISHTFADDGEYSVQDMKYSNINGQILVTEDMLTMTKPVEGQNLDIQLTRTPSYPRVNEQFYYKITFIDEKTGRNHPHIDFVMRLNDSSGKSVDGVGGHTVDGQEFGKFKFDKQDTFTPSVTVSIISFVPIKPQTLIFSAVVTPEFPSIFVPMIVAGAMVLILALYRGRFDIHFRCHLSISTRAEAYSSF